MGGVTKRIWFVAGLTFAGFTAFAVPASANDRLPKRIQGPFGIARKEVQKYTKYILEKVWRPRLAELKASEPDPKKRAEKADAMVDDIVHILLPYTTKVVDDVIFGTGETYLKMTMPKRGLVALGGKPGTSAVPASGNPTDALKQAVADLGGAHERELNDRIQQALTEELEDSAQREVERALDLPVRGRGRETPRKLTDQYEPPYMEKIRRDVHSYIYWALRKKYRLELTHLAMSKSQEEIDRAEHTGDIWGITSAASYEAWAMNRLEIDFKWGRPSWEIDRRRIRRRMDQDQAKGAWAFAKLVKELTSKETLSAANNEIDRRIGEEMAKGPLREKAERFPGTTKELREAFERVKDGLDPIADRAMDRVKLPPDMEALARENGRKFLREELGEEMTLAVQRHAIPWAAWRRVNDRLPGMVRHALDRFDPGVLTGAARRKKAAAHVRTAITNEIDDDIDVTLRELGDQSDLGNPGLRERRVREVRKKTGIDKAVDAEIRRHLKREMGEERE
ncbi:MAG: hypothetical protein HYY84_06790 [Deltaproteobacteria bacterium]|nr:hypothetical protein [Deltaproteobacteria bacterium]